MPRPAIQQLHHQVLLALELAGTAQDLDHLSSLLNRPHRTTELLPVIGSLVTAGYLVKVAGPAPAPSTANAPVRSRRQPSGPVHFQLTEQGREELRSAPVPTRLAMAQMRRSQGAVPPDLAELGEDERER